MLAGRRGPLIAAFSLLFLGCDRPARQEDALRQARATFALRCASCHGATGRGDGAEGARLDPKPRDLTDRSWQAATTDEQIRRVIVNGGPLVGQRQAMPGAPDLMNRPEELAGLVRHVRGLR